MRNKLIAVIFIQLLFYVDLKSQNKQGCVNYKHVTNLFNVGVTQNAYLYFSNTESVFIHSKGKKGQIMKKADGSDLEDSDEVPATIGGWYQDTIGEIVYKNLMTKKLVNRSFFYRIAYLTEEPKMPNLKWTILNEKKKIGSFDCQKATTRFRGRNYIAWFTMTIPISNGPWKLQGLPGLILEATDDTGEVKFLFVSIDMPLPKIFDIKPPTDGKKVIFETYKKADEIEFENHKRATESVDYGRGGGITVTRGKKNAIEKEYEE
jgi:GLPGLI family protein